MSNPDSLPLATDFAERAAELIAAGRELAARGWVPATSGNLSARLADGTIAITVSGRHKGRLTPADIMVVDADGRSLDGRTPSAETGLHARIYRRVPGATAVLHPHSPGATVLSRRAGDAIVLAGYELLKAFAGVTSHETAVTIPVFDNDQDIPRLAARVDAWMDQHGPGQGFVIRGHGLYTWGETVARALNSVEALEFLFDCELRGGGSQP